LSATQRRNPAPKRVRPPAARPPRRASSRWLLTPARKEMERERAATGRWRAPPRGRWRRWKEGGRRREGGGARSWRPPRRPRRCRSRGPCSCTARRILRHRIASPAWIEGAPLAVDPSCRIEG
jgi:hypothetical protein